MSKAGLAKLLSVMFHLVVSRGALARYLGSYLYLVYEVEYSYSEERI